MTEYLTQIDWTSPVTYVAIGAIYVAFMVFVGVPTVKHLNNKITPTDTFDEVSFHVFGTILMLIFAPVVVVGYWIVFRLILCNIYNGAVAITLGLSNEQTKKRIKKWMQ